MQARVVLHLHTNHSPDSSRSVASLIKQCQTLGYQALAITDHDTMAGAREAERLRPEPLVIIPGIEVTTTAGHVLGLFLTRAPAEQRWPAVAHEIREQGGLVVIVHPLRPSNGMSEADIVNHRDVIDGLEVWNPSNSPEGNEAGVRLAAEHHLIRSAGADDHDGARLGRAELIFEVPELTLSALKTVFQSGHGRVMMDGEEI